MSHTPDASLAEVEPVALRVRDAWIPLAIFACAHAATWAAFVVSARLPGKVPFPADTAAWDGSWFATIATQGYPDSVPAGAQSALAFLPVFPLAAGAVMDGFGLGWILAAQICNVIAGAAFTVLVWLLAHRVLARGKANLAVVAVSFFPGTVVFAMTYSEPIALALTAGCLLALLDKRWLLAGLLGAVATATRLHAIALFVACLVAAGVEVRNLRTWRAFVAPALCPLGLLAFFGFLWVHTGDPLGFFHAQQAGWQQEVVPGINNVRNVLHFVRSPLDDYNIASRTLFLVTLLAGVVAYLRWRPRPPLALTAYTGASLVLTLTYVSGTLPRLVLAAFPLIFAACAVLKPTAIAVMIALFAFASAMLALIMSQSILITP